MILALAVKILATGFIVIVITVAVARLGPRIGGILAGTPIVIGPAFYFLGHEQSAQFVVAAAISTLHALAATLMFLMAYVSVAGRLSAVASAAVGVGSWLVGAVLFSQLPQGIWPALIVYAAIFAGALVLEYQLRLAETRATAGARWGDLLLRGASAGVLVGATTTIGAHFGPTLSGVLAGFPVGFLVISLTLYQRFGSVLARTTMVAAQRGMLSLVAFAAAMAVLTPTWGVNTAFWSALVGSLLVSALLLAVSSVLTHMAKPA